MSSILVLVGLLVLAYLGSIFVGGRAIRGYGLPSGSEWVLLGLVVGPHALGAVDRATLAALEPVAQVALAWLLQKPGVTAPIVGTSKTSQLEEAVAAAKIKLTDEQMKRIEEPYRPHRILGHG